MQRKRISIDSGKVVTFIKYGVVVFVGAVAAGCAITSSETVLEPVQIDWSDEGQVAVYEEWSAYGCEGAPVASICFEQDGKSVGRLILGSAIYEPDSVDVNLELLTDERAKALSDRFGCGELEIRRMEQESLIVAGVDGVRTTHLLSNAAGGIDITLIQYLTVVESELMTLTTATPAPQGCTSPDDMWIEPTILEPILPLFDGIAAGLPQSDTPQPEAPGEDSAPPHETSDFDWGNISEHQIQDFVVGPCGGEAPVACVSRDGEIIGTVEYWSSPTSEFEFLGDSVGDPEAINLVAKDYLDSNGESRPLECPGQTFRAIGPSEANVASTAGSLWGFSMVEADKLTELTLVYGVVQDDRLHLLTANAGGEQACFDLEGQFSVSDLEEFSPAFRTLAADSLWPDSSDESS